MYQLPSQLVLPAQPRARPLISGCGYLLAFPQAICGSASNGEKEIGIESDGTQGN